MASQFKDLLIIISIYQLLSAAYSENSERKTDAKFCGAYAYNRCITKCGNGNKCINTFGSCFDCFVHESVYYDMETALIIIVVLFTVTTIISWLCVCCKCCWCYKYIHKSCNRSKQNGKGSNNNRRNFGARIWFYKFATSKKSLYFIQKEKLW